MQCLLCLCGKSFHTMQERGSGSRSGYLRDPSQCHCPHSESLVMPEFLFLVLLLPSPWNHWPVRDLSEEINMLISLDLPPQLLPLCLCASQDVAFPGPSGRTMSCVPWWAVTQTLSRLSAGAGRNAFHARGFACAGRAVCFVSEQSKLGRLALFSRAPLPSGLYREHPLLPRVLSPKCLSLSSLGKSSETN